MFSGKITHFNMVGNTIDNFYTNFLLYRSNWQIERQIEWALIKDRILEAKDNIIQMQMEQITKLQNVSAKEPEEEKTQNAKKHHVFEIYAGESGMSQFCYCYIGLRVSSNNRISKQKSIPPNFDRIYHKCYDSNSLTNFMNIVKERISVFSVEFNKIHCNIEPQQLLELLLWKRCRIHICSLFINFFLHTYTKRYYPTSIFVTLSHR